MCSVSSAAIPALTLRHRHDNALLHGRWALETVAVDPVEELLFQSHIVEGIDSFIIVGFDLSCGYSK
jgi:hypothetical protein